jgi:hypothetical protein
MVVGGGHIPILRLKTTLSDLIGTLELPCPVSYGCIMVFQSSSTLWHGVYSHLKRLRKLLQFSLVYLAISAYVG